MSPQSPMKCSPESQSGTNQSLGRLPSERRYSVVARGSALLALLLALPLHCKSADVEPLTPPVVPVVNESADMTATGAADLAAAVDPNAQFNQTTIYKTAAEFSGFVGNGVAVRSAGSAAAVGLSASKLSALNCQSEDIDGGAARYDAASGLCAGTDPAPSGLPSGVTYYNGGSFFYGTLVSPEIKATAPAGSSGRLGIDHVIASWNAETPPGTWLQVHVRVRLASGLSRWYPLPIWASDFSTVKRHSVKGASDSTAGIDTDTFYMKGGQAAESYQLRVTLFSTTSDKTPTLRLLAAVASRDSSTYPAQTPNASAWGIDLNVPQRSQELPEYKGKDYGGGGAVWCSPTCTSMVMAYWGIKQSRAELNQTVPDTAAGCFDWVYNGTGNWPFNTAHAATLGLSGYVTRLYSLTDAESFIRSGVPLIISIAFGVGELPGAPISKTNGHLIVLRGFDRNGDPIVNDPAARTNEATRLVYPRAALEKAWAHSHRTAYVLTPQ